MEVLTRGYTDTWQTDEGECRADTKLFLFRIFFANIAKIVAKNMKYFMSHSSKIFDKIFDFFFATLAGGNLLGDLHSLRNTLF